MKTCGRVDPRFIHLGSSRRLVVGFKSWRLYPRKKSPRYPLNMGLDKPQSRSGRRGEVKILDLTGTRTLIPRLAGTYPVAIPTVLLRLT
jgi:hypothetical protein